MISVKNFFIAILMVSAGNNSFQACLAQAAKSPPVGLQASGGRWYVKLPDAGDKPLYLYQDGERFVDLFSYHQQDSNQDGIDTVLKRNDVLRVVE